MVPVRSLGLNRLSRDQLRTSLAGFFFWVYYFPMPQISKEERVQKLKAKQAQLAQEIAALTGDAADTITPPQKIPQHDLLSSAPVVGASNIDERESDYDIAKNVQFVSFQPNHSLMGKPDLREQDQKPQRLFFYKRLTDDKILIFTEAEASFMMESSHRPILRQIGVSDGRAYWNYLRNCGVRVGERILVTKAQEILNAAMDAEMEAARGNYDDPMPQNVHFDSTVRRHKNAKNIIQGFSPS